MTSFSTSLPSTTIMNTYNLFFRHSWTTIIMQRLPSINSLLHLSIPRAYYIHQRCRCRPRETIWDLSLALPHLLHYLARLSGPCMLLPAICQSLRPTRCPVNGPPKKSHLFLEQEHHHCLRFPQNDDDPTAYPRPSWLLRTLQHHHRCLWSGNRWGSIPTW